MIYFNKIFQKAKPNERGNMYKRDTMKSVAKANIAVHQNTFGIRLR